MYSGEYDACDVTLSVYPHRASLKNMPDHGGKICLTTLVRFPSWSGIFFKLARCGYTLRVTSQVLQHFICFLTLFLAAESCLLIKCFRVEGNSKLKQAQPRSQGFSLFVIGKSGKGPGTGRSHDFQHPDIVGVNKL